MHNSEKMGNADQDTNSNYEQWKVLGQREFPSPLIVEHQKPKELIEYRTDDYGNVYFNRAGDTIVFGETKYARAVDDFPHETNEEDYYNSVVGIKTNDGNQYYISQGVFLDRGNDKKVDLLKRRQDDPNYRFPSITIGEPLPYDLIARNIPEGINIGIVTEVVCLGEAPSASPNENKTKKDIQDYIANEIKQSETAKQIRRIH